MLWSSGQLTIYNSKFEQVDLPPNEATCIITDPPYAKYYSHLYWHLGDKSKQWLKPGGSLLTIVPHYNIPLVTNYLNQHLKYRWILCMDQFSGPHARMLMGIEICWKPILWYVKDSYPSRGYVVDMFKVRAPTHKNHMWQQSLDWAMFLVEKFTKEGDLVIDPMMGSGTVLLACHKLNRRAIGIESITRVAERAAKDIQEFIRESPNE